MQAAMTQDLDPVALYTADELYDLEDADVLSRRRVSPAVYQELQARVRREHRAFGGLVRTVHPRTGAVVDAVYVKLPTPPATITATDLDRVVSALVASARRFLAGSPDGTALAELRTWDGRSIFVEYDPATPEDATCWTGGEVARRTSMKALLDSAVWEPS